MQTAMITPSTPLDPQSKAAPPRSDGGWAAPGTFGRALSDATAERGGQSSDGPSSELADTATVPGVRRTQAVDDSLDVASNVVAASTAAPAVPTAAPAISTGVAHGDQSAVPAECELRLDPAIAVQVARWKSSAEPTIVEPEIDVSSMTDTGEPGAGAAADCGLLPSNGAHQPEPIVAAVTTLEAGPPRSPRATEVAAIAAPAAPPTARTGSARPRTDPTDTLQPGTAADPHLGGSGSKQQLNAASLDTEVATIAAPAAPPTARSGSAHPRTDPADTFRPGTVADPRLGGSGSEQQLNAASLDGRTQGLLGHEATTARSEPTVAPGASIAATHGAASVGMSAGANVASAAATAPMMEAQLSARPSSPEFAPMLGAQLSIMARKGVGEARLHLNPAEMGPISVQITLNGQAALVNLAAEHAFTRQILEQSMPTLASALRDAGLTLTGGGVFEQPQGARSQEGGASRADGAETGQEGDAAQGREATERRVPRAARGVVDLYA